MHSTIRPKHSTWIAHELARLDIDIAAHSEFFYSENVAQVILSIALANQQRKDVFQLPSLQTCQSVTLIASSPCVCHLVFSSMPLSSLCMLQLSRQILPETKFVYRPMLLRNFPANDKIVILADFHARVGRDPESWKDVLGKHGVGNYNDSGY